MKHTFLGGSRVMAPYNLFLLITGQILNLVVFGSYLAAPCSHHLCAKLLPIIIMTFFSWGGGIDPRALCQYETLTDITVDIRRMTLQNNIHT